SAGAAAPASTTAAPPFASLATCRKRIRRSGSQSSYDTFASPLVIKLSQRDPYARRRPNAYLSPERGRPRDDRGRPRDDHSHHPRPLLSRRLLDGPQAFPYLTAMFSDCSVFLLPIPTAKMPSAVIDARAAQQPQQHQPPKHQPPQQQQQPPPPQPQHQPQPKQTAKPQTSTQQAASLIAAGKP